MFNKLKKNMCCISPQEVENNVDKICSHKISVYYMYAQANKDFIFSNFISMCTFQVFALEISRDRLTAKFGSGITTDLTQKFTLIYTHVYIYNR